MLKLTTVLKEDSSALDGHAFTCSVILRVMALHSCLPRLSFCMEDQVLEIMRQVDHFGDDCLSIR